ncbi:hypothetical protein GQ607_012550, partial [Colletotrichum asianum]
LKLSFRLDFYSSLVINLIFILKILLAYFYYKLLIKPKINYFSL